ncbi:MAG: MG2 domain-containing protein [Bacteroidota bacterium]
MKPYLKFVIGFAILSSSLSCNIFNKNRISIISTNFGEEVGRSQNLIFRFSANLIEKPEDLNVWENTELIKFTPAINGKFKWISKNELLFSPAGKLGVCQAYEAKPTKLLLSKIKTDKSISQKKDIKFHTPYLKLGNINAYWAKNKQTNRAEIKLNTEFNYSVKPRQLADKLKLTINKKDYGFSLQGDKIDERQDLNITDKKATNEICDIEVTIDQGLQANGSSYITDKAMSQNLILASGNEIAITKIETAYEDQIGIATIITSQELESGNIAACYTIAPPVKTTAEIEANKIIIRGEFAEDINYTITINQQLKGTLGGQLKSVHTDNLFFGEMPPAIAFTNKQAQYITNKGNQNIGLNIVNIDNVNLKITKIYRNNILLFLNNMRGYDYDSYYDEDGDYISSSEEYYYDDYNEQYGSVITDREMSTKDMAKNKGVSLLNVNLGDEKKFKGIYNIKVSSMDDNYISASKLVSVSDIGILAKKSKNDIMVMVNSLINSNPLVGVEVSLVSTNNQTIYTLKTDGKGIAHFSDLEQKASGFTIAMITADFEEDFNYLLLKDNRVETARFETDGISENKAGWWAFIYGDRSIYRPGETVYLNTIVRNEALDNVKKIPVIVKMVMPNGRVFQEKSITTNEQGAAPVEFTTTEQIITGTYSIDVYNTNDVLLNSHNISIEEFVPDKIKVNQSLNKEAFNSEDEIRYTGEALTFFGPASAGRNYECEFVFKSEPFTAPKYPAYHFAIKNKVRFEPDVRQGKTDDAGLFTEVYKIPEEWRNTGYISGKVLTTVFDENSRPVNRSKNFDIYSQNVFYGIARHDDWLGTNAPATFNCIALNKDRMPVNQSNVTVEIIQYQWQNLLERYYGSYKYNSKPIEKIISSQLVNFKNGKADVRFTPRLSGEYEIRIKQAGSNTGYTYSSFYAYEYGSTSSSSFEVSQEGEVIIEADKEQYNNGDEAKFLFKTPFDGKLLVTIDRNKVFEYHVVEVKDKTASLELDMDDEFVPNIYISATLIKQSANSDIPLTVAHGLKNIVVIRKKTQLPVTITAVENSRSKTKQKITVKTEPNAEVTIAVVDEGILSIKGGKTPDPFNYFYQKRALEVESFDLYARLFPELLAGSSGGDAGAYKIELDKRLNPLSVVRFKPLALWSGVIKTNGSGVAEFTANIPQFYGAVRIMAVAYKDKAFGNAEKEMKIFDPMVISSSLPRFLSPGDEITMAINMMNTSKKAATATTGVSISGPLEIVAVDNASYSINPNKEKMALYTLRAKADIGKASVAIKVTAMGETFTENIDIAVRPAAGLQKKSSEGLLAGGQIENIDLGADFMGTPTLQIVVDQSPLAQLGNKMRDLLHYPHGCAEQTISTAFPQVYFGEYAKAVGQYTNYEKLGANDFNPVYNVNEAIKKINTLAADDGNISYWPGDYHYNLFINAYALHFLTECEKNGYTINTGLKNRLILLCTQSTGSSLERREYVMSESGQEVWKPFITREKIYALYALAVAGSPNMSAMNYCKNNPGKLHTSSKYLLAGTFALTGDLSTFRNMIPKVYTRENDYRYYYDDYSSPIRDKALVLNALVEADINNPQTLSLVKSLVTDLKNSEYCNTNEMSFSILALGKFSKRLQANGTGKADVFVDGKNMGTYNGKSLHLQLARKAQNIQIKNTGKGSIYFSVVYEGISQSGNITEEDKGLIVRRTFLNREGRVISVDNIKQNDLVIVKITANTTFSTGCKNVVITDILPAGLEIENPRITATNELEWMSNQWFVTYMDVRDDRINYFTDLYSDQTTTLYYMCRAVSKGKFILGPVQADAMYDGAVHSYNGKGILIVN